MNVDAYVRYLQSVRRPLKIMEVCGTHTGSIVQNGIHSLLPPEIKLVSGPGCPVCVTEAGYIDHLIAFSQQKNACVLSFGDLFRVRGTEKTFSEARADGGSFHIVYSPFDAVEFAISHPETNIALAAVGFETTAPLYALLLETLEKEHIRNVKLALSLKTMIPALSLICAQEAVDGFICPGHVSVIIGWRAFEPLCEQYQKPFVVAGFEPAQILAALCEIAAQTGSGVFSVKNQYQSVVSEQGNTAALALMAKYFTPADGYWRGIGLIKQSSLALRAEYADYALENPMPPEESPPPGCRCTDVLLGRITPPECALFAKACTPEQPVGACMTSREGACACWYTI